MNFWFPSNHQFSLAEPTTSSNGRRKHKANGALSHSNILQDEARTADEYGGDLPPKKIRITEEKMAAKLRNFHLSSDLQKDEVSSKWFFMQKPNETFQEIEDRMSTDEEADDEEPCSVSTTNAETTVELSPELQGILKKQQSVFSPWLRTPSSSLAVVLWKPPGDFINELLETVKGEENGPLSHMTTCGSEPPKDTAVKLSSDQRSSAEPDSCNAQSEKMELL